MRTGAEYRQSLRDGRKVWIMGGGVVDDVTTHPLTKPMVDEYVAWYDLHSDPEWQDILLAPPDGDGKRIPVACVVPKSSDDLRRMGRCFSSTLFLSAGNITHTPAYGYLIALGVLHSVQQLDTWREQVANAAAYRESIAQTGRFLTFSSGGATIGYRFRAESSDRAALRIIKERDDGIVVQGKIGMHTSPPYAEDVYVGGLSGMNYEGRRVTFVVPVGAPGVTVLCRKASARHPNPFMAPLSGRFDELDGQMWLEDVFVPWERVFLLDVAGEPGSAASEQRHLESIAVWLFWHQLYAWLAKGEFTLGLALACADAMGLKEHQQTLDYIADLLVDVQTVRSCQAAAELDPQFTSAGYCMPGQVHLAAGSIAMEKARQRMTEILRVLPGSSLVVAPADTDLASAQVSAGLEESFGGGGYTALQRSALLQMAWDHVASALDGRESAFELHANGGIPAWRARLRRSFSDYDRLANGVLSMVSVQMPEVDLSGLRSVPQPRRQVTPSPDSSGQTRSTADNATHSRS